MPMVRKRDSIYFQLFQLLILAALVSGLFFLVTNWAGDSLLNWFYISSNYEEKKNGEYIGRLQEYVSQNQLSTEDTKELTEWVRRQRVVALQLYKNGILVYNSEYPEQDMEAEQIEAGDYEWTVYYPVRFSDGEAEISIYGMYFYQYYNYAVIAELLLSFALFVGIVMLGIRYKIRYIRKLSSEIEILEGGDLDYEITVTGRDELAALAKGLDDMRGSFREKVRQEAHLVAANHKMITEMSHDIRTPLTTVMLYTEILRKRQVKSEEQFWEYIDKIDQKTRRMKQLTDHLFEYALVTGETEVKLEEPESFEAVFYDLLSETCAYLEQSGFHTELKFEWKKETVRVNMEFVIRVLDNITSNLVKYADPAFPIYICSEHTEKSAGIVFENRSRKLEKKTDSTGIGLENIKKMMERMNGTCAAEEREGCFRLRLSFPCTERQDRV